MHKNNFDFLRLLFAIFVLITHSYAIAGLRETDFLSSITNGNLTFSYIGLTGFFTISGYMIFLSGLRSKTIGDFFLKRILRIYPGLLVVLLLSSIFGVFLTSYPPRDYFSETAPYTYVLYNLWLLGYTKYQILDIFHSNPYPYAINGSLWSLSYEFTFYIATAVTILLVKKNKTILKYVFLLAFVLLYVFHLLNIPEIRGYFEAQMGSILNLKKDYRIPFTSLSSALFARYGLFFIAGALLAQINLNLSKKHIYLTVGLIGLILSIYCGCFSATQFFTLPLIVIFAGLYQTRGLAGLNTRIGDFSYGTYLYGFPIQQALMYFFKLDYISLMILSIPISLIFGYLSWNLVEKRALAAKQRVK